MGEQLHSNFVLLWLSLGYSKYSRVQGRCCDLLFHDVDNALRRNLSEIFSDKRLTFKKAAVHLQSAGNDCGVFPVVYATALAFTQHTLHPVKFKQD